MKSQFIKPLLILLGYIFLAGTCAKESEEKYDEEQGYQDAMYGRGSIGGMRKSAAVDWQQYNESSKKLIAIAEANLNTIHLRIKPDDTSKGNMELVSFYNKSTENLSILKKQLAEEDKIFAPGAANLTEVNIKDNSKFKRNFRAKLLELNTSLDMVVEGEEAVE